MRAIPNFRASARQSLLAEAPQRGLQGLGCLGLLESSLASDSSSAVEVRLSSVKSSASS